MTLVSNHASAQTFEVPTDYVFDSTTDYSLYEEAVVDCFNWLMDSPCNIDLVKRKAATSFLNKWIEQTPTITVTVNQDIVTYYNSSPDLLIIFMGGWVANAITTGDSLDYDGALAGTKAVLTYYQKNKDYLKQDDHIDKLIVRQAKGKLEKYIRFALK